MYGIRLTSHLYFVITNYITLCSPNTLIRLLFNMYQHERNHSTPVALNVLNILSRFKIRHYKFSSLVKSVFSSRDKLLSTYRTIFPLPYFSLRFLSPT